VFARVLIHSFCDVEDAVILPSVEIGRGCQLRRVVIDKYCKIPPNTRIGFDPEEDRRLFHVTDRGITLVTPAMLGQEVHFLR